MGKKKVLIISPSNFGTIALCTLNLYRAFCETGDYEVKCVIVHKFDNGYIDFDSCESFTGSVSSLLSKPFVMIKQLFWIKKIKKTYKPDVTISTLNSCSTINVLSGGKEKKIGIFHSPHFQIKDKGWVVYLFSLLEFNFIYIWLDKIVCVSTEVKKDILTSFVQYKNKDVSIIYNVHDFDKILCKSKVSLTNEEKDIVNENSIVYIGRLDRNKAPKRALLAFAQAINDIPDNANLVFIGKDTDSLKPELDEFISINKISDKVHFLGFQDNPYKFLNVAKCLITTSYSEGLPGVIIEALSLGKPVVTTNSSDGVWEILSCYDRHDENLDSIVKTPDGIITSNNSRYDESKFDDDIINLRKGIVEVYKMNNIAFSFKEKLNPKLIIDSFMKL